MLQKAGGCDGCYDASATSVQAIGGLGYAEFTFGNPASVALVGLASAFDGTPSSVDFSIRTQGGDAEVRERGAYPADVPFSAGDVFRITVNSGIVTYTKNGTAWIVPIQ